jgi:hypothetical protein
MYEALEGGNHTPITLEVTYQKARAASAELAALGCGGINI